MRLHTFAPVVNLNDIKQLFKVVECIIERKKKKTYLGLQMRLRSGQLVIIIV